MRNIDASIAAEIAKESFRFFYLLELQLTATYRFNDIDIPIYHGGELFAPRSFSFESLTGSANLSVESLDIDIDDTDQVIGALVLGEDVRNKIAILYFGVITDTPNAMHIQEFMRGIVGGWEIYGDSKVRLNITNEMILWNKKCLRPQSSSCPWTFKGTECAYAGGQTWCDQSYARCLDLLNTDNFGGERFLPAITEREIWWGRQRA